MHAHEAHAYRVIAEEPEVKLLTKDELFQELEDFIMEVGKGGEIDPRVYPG